MMWLVCTLFFIGGFLIRGLFIQAPETIIPETHEFCDARFDNMQAKYNAAMQELNATIAGQS